MGFGIGETTTADLRSYKWIALLLEPCLYLKQYGLGLNGRLNMIKLLFWFLMLAMASVAALGGEDNKNSE